MFVVCICNSVCVYTVSQKNDTNVAHYNFSAHQPIVVIFVGDVAITRRLVFPPNCSFCSSMQI